MKNELTKQNEGVFNSIETFESSQRMAVALSKSSIIPKAYQNKVEDVLICMEMAHRTGTSVIMIMQNIDIIQGKPSWSSKYVISALNSCGRFTPLRFKYEDLGEKTVQYLETVWHQGNKQTAKKEIKINNIRCIAISKDVEGNEIEGPEVTIEMAVREGWWTKPGSKWPTMTKLMLSYRSAKFFGNLYAPDVLMGMQSADEVVDISPIISDKPQSNKNNLNKQFEAAEVVEPIIEAEDDGDNESIM